MDRFLLAVSDHPNGRLASRLVGLLAGARGKPTTVLRFQSHSARRGQSGVESEIAFRLRIAADQARNCALQKPGYAERRSEVAGERTRG